jgi:hypothetical protein
VGEPDGAMTEMVDLDTGSIGYRYCTDEIVADEELYLKTSSNVTYIG